MWGGTCSPLGPRSPHAHPQRPGMDTPPASRSAPGRYPTSVRVIGSGPGATVTGDRQTTPARINPTLPPGGARRGPPPATRNEGCRRPRSATPYPNQPRPVHDSRVHHLARSRRRHRPALHTPSTGRHPAGVGGPPHPAPLPLKTGQRPERDHAQRRYTVTPQPPRQKSMVVGAAMRAV